MSFGKKLSLHTCIIKSDNEKLFNYLVHANDAGILVTYLHSMEGSGTAYIAEVTPDVLATIAQQNEKSTDWARKLLFAQETSILWCVETEQSSAKITWKKNLANGMKLALGSMTMVEHPSAPSDMLSICSAALQRETSRTASVEGQCESLERENTKLRRLAEEAVQARRLLEDDLIAKFARLLNEKKAKIRALQELLAERRAEDLNGAVGSGGARDTAAVTPDRPLSEDADQPDSDAYDQETDVDTGGEEEGPGPSGAPPRNDSLELDCDALDEPLPVRPKRPAPEPERVPPLDKRRLHDSDDMLDLV